LISSSDKSSCSSVVSSAAVCHLPPRLNFGMYDAQTDEGSEEVGTDDDSEEPTVEDFVG
jgi:hypothetical protein